MSHSWIFYCVTLLLLSLCGAAHALCSLKGPDPTPSPKMHHLSVPIHRRDDGRVPVLLALSDRSDAQERLLLCRG